MKILFTLLSYMFILNFCFTQDVLNVNLIGNEIRVDTRYSGSWSYIDEAENEYALLGAKSGTAIYSISSTGNISEVAFIPGPSSNWREITVLGKHAYITTEGVDSTQTGLQVIELSNLPDTAFLLTNYNEHFTQAHILQRDIYSELPYIYVMGTQTTRGVHIIDVSDPMNPVQVGLYEPGYYIHDAHVNGDLLFACAFNESKVDILDISDKTNPTFITDIADPGGSTHSAWLTEDKTHLILADELDGLPGRIFNIEDLEEIYEVATFSANLESLVHNPYVRGDFVFVSHNTEGLRVYDIKDPSLPVEVGYYDTYDGPSGGFFGLWSACPYYPSGKIIGGDRTKGLFVWEFEETRAARIYGTVIDSISGVPIPNAEIVLEQFNDTLKSDANGQFKYGLYPGDLSLKITAESYIDNNLELELNENDDLQVEIKMAQLGSGTEQVTFNFFLNIYPNPTRKEFSIELPTILKGNLLSIVGANGQKIYEEIIETDIQVINVEGFAQGLYFVNILDEQGRILLSEQLVVE